MAEHASSLAKLELELAVLELKGKVGSLGIRSRARGSAPASSRSTGSGYLLATIAAALAIVLDLWLALLVVTLGLLRARRLLGLLARARIKKGTRPFPNRRSARRS